MQKDPEFYEKQFKGLFEAELINELSQIFGNTYFLLNMAVRVS